MMIQPDKPGPDQESVWDYPRPPRLEDSHDHVRIVFNDATIAASTRTKRMLETSHPPVFYIPPQDITQEYLSPSPHRTFCEWKGTAHYCAVRVGTKAVEQAAWYYPNPSARFADLAGYVAFYPSKMDTCSVNGEVVFAQPGDFYGGWITSKVVGPFKGTPGTHGW